VKEALASLGCALGVDAWLRRRSRRRLLVLMYHGVVERALEPFCWHQLPVEAFRRQLTWVARHFEVLPLEDALARLADDALPDHAAAITFDDGLRNNATLAAPVLRDLGLPATIFLVTDRVGSSLPLWPDRVHLALATTDRGSVDLADLGLGTRALGTHAERADAVAATLQVLKTRPPAEKDAFVDRLVETTGTADVAPGPFALMTWEEIDDLGRDGAITFGPHGLTHEILSRCDDVEVRRQVEGSCRAIEERTGARPAVFAYPNGRAIDFDTRAKAAVEAAGCRWGLSTVEGRNGVGAEPLALRRTCVGSDLGWGMFRALCSR
jgi:peptidoglycan/xylan/chitin deacetylase (PgdA/CDA1 family)